MPRGLRHCSSWTGMSYDRVDYPYRVYVLRCDGVRSVASQHVSRRGDPGPRAARCPSYLLQFTQRLPDLRTSFPFPSTAGKPSVCARDSAVSHPGPSLPPPWSLAAPVPVPYPRQIIPIRLGLGFRLAGLYNPHHSHYEHSERCLTLWLGAPLTW